MDPEKVRPADFHYDLPEERIAKYPLHDRSASKLLFYHKGAIQHGDFRQIPDMVPGESLLVFNNTRVIPARLIFRKETGARIEIFLLEPKAPSQLMEEVMTACGSCTWECMIGNARKWKPGTSLSIHLTDTVELVAIRTANGGVRFQWNDKISFSEVIELAGNIPLPPYIDRKPDQADRSRYQTVYSEKSGAVAAPTAGLHFTPEIMRTLAHRCKTDKVTLHVSAGTFQPITTNAKEHEMHREQIVVTRENIENLLASNYVICVGTTSLRTVESIYWYGVRLLGGKEDFLIPKLSPYEAGSSPAPKEALKAVLDHMHKEGRHTLVGHTEIFIFPGYSFKLCKGLVTNFHLPGTTLMMLVASFVGPDWKRIYEEALQHNYRFLSYGDVSLLLN